MLILVHYFKKMFKISQSIKQILESDVLCILIFHATPLIIPCLKISILRLFGVASIKAS
jgi:hypothetical protein